NFSGLRADSLSGRVLDPQGNVCADANLKLFDRVTGEQRNALSDKYGNYKFDGIPTGRYLIEAHCAGSALVSSQEIFVEGDQKTDLTLSISGVQTQVVVTAAMTPLNAMEVAKTLDIVDAEQFAVRDVFQISEVIRALPGVQVQTLEGPGSFTRI